MALLSVRSVIIALSLACIALTAAVCTYIAISSADSALDETRGAADIGLQKCFAQGATALNSTRSANREAVAACFNGAAAAITLRTEELLNATAGRVLDTLEAVLQTYQRTALQWYDYVRTTRPLSYTDTAEFLDSLQRRLWADHRRLRKIGLTSITIGTMTNKVRISYEDDATAGQSGELHHFRYAASNGERGTFRLGTMMEGGGYNSTPDPVNDGLLSEVKLPRHEPLSCQANKISPHTGRPCVMDYQVGCRRGLFVKTGGVIDDGWCYYPGWEVLDQPGVQLAALLFPVGQPRWTPISSTSSYMGLGVIIPWGYGARKIGLMMSVFDLETFSSFLKSIEVGGQHARARKLITVERNWVYNKLPLPDLDQRGVMVAVSHGRGTYYVHKPGETPRWVQKTRHATDASDPIVRAVARHLDTVVNGSYSAVVNRVVSVALNSSLTGGGHSEIIPGKVWEVPTTDTSSYLNGYTRPEDSTRDPLPGYAVDGEEFFVTVRHLRSEVSEGDLPAVDDGETGQMQWFLTLAIDREYVLGETDRAQNETRAAINESNREIAEEVKAGEWAVQEDIRRSNDDVQESLDQDRVMLYIIVAGTAVLLMILSVVFASAIVAPIDLLRWQMAQVAQMKLDAADEGGGVSRLQEVEEMQLSFAQMVSNLREYRSYMPASVLVGGEDDEEDLAEDQPPSSRKQSMMSTEGSTSAKDEASAGAGSDGSAGRDRRMSPASRSTRVRESDVSQLVHAQKAAAKATMGLGLNKKPVSFLTFNVIDFVSAAKHSGAGSLLALQAELLAPLVDAVKGTKGIPDGFNADRFYASFNTVRPLTQHRPASARCAQHISGKVSDTLAEGGRGRASFACSSGEAFCGNMGVEGMKKYCCIGAAASFVHLVEQQNARLKTTLLVDGKIAAEVASSMHIRTVAIVKHKGDRKRVFEVQGPKAMSEEEWMYQLETAAKDDPNKCFNDAMELYYQCKLEEALALLKSDEHQTVQHEVLREELRVQILLAQHGA
eukprot:TRINITY_DN3496_c0_g8_i1.p1 TRINITY_DN3496_c0_g8~~TRINITY_DN3496_c0_g8_i1.p1  ORF type:complete len:1005 (+),score=305.99 TRINITY_DN3496_c0_g8_i1:126-3140(+)